MTQAQNDTDVLIVGAGPVGLCCSRLLSRMGVRNRVVERRTGLHTAPQAHVVSARSVEVFRAAGIDAGKLATVATRLEDQMAIRWVHTLAGPMLGQVELGDPMRAMKMMTSTPTPNLNIPQHRLEPILYEAARVAGAPIDFEREWVGSEQDNDGVVSQIHSAATCDTEEVRSRFLLACDGASSPVRHAVGIEMNGPAHIQTYLSVFLETDLRDVVRDNPGLLFWHIDPLEPGVFIAHDIDSTWIYMHPFDPDVTPRESFTLERCHELVKAAIGASASYEIRETGMWQMTCQVAERYREQNVFLVGDAAHRFPPTGGMGMNTGIADAFNLTWKIAAVLAGNAGNDLLTTYDVERQPVAQWAADKSLENHTKMMAVVEAMEIDPSTPPLEARAQIRSLPEDEGRSQRVQAAINGQAEHFDMLGFDLGHAYEQGALAPDGTAAPPRGVSSLELTPTTRPGARLPHAWVQHDGDRVSTLDLASLTGPTLLCGPEGESWRQAAASLGVRALSIGAGGDVDDSDRAWEALRQTSPEGALLVRPDRHVAWRSSDASESCVKDLEGALAAMYCKSNEVETGA
ncbi:MAG: FAD-dependent monooxygenase [Acidobacteriota bacterium]